MRFIRASRIRICYPTLLVLSCAAPSTKSILSPSGSDTAVSARVTPPATADATRLVAATGSVHFEEPQDIGPRSFRVLGPFPNGPGATFAGLPVLDRDYLTAIGGETAAHFDGNTTIEWDKTTLAARDASLTALSTLNFANLFGGDTDRKTAYAYAEWIVGKPLRALAVFGSDDGAVVWLNGTRVHRVAMERALDRDSDRFELPLSAGTNRVLIKVENGSGSWGFALRVLDDQGRSRLEALDARRHLDQFEPRPVSGNYLLDESFPGIEWNRPAVAERVLKKGSLRARWYGPDLRETDRPDKDGPYTAVVEATTLDDYTYRRMVTFAKLAAHRVPWSSPIHTARTPPFAELPVIDVPMHFDVPLSDAQRAELSRQFWYSSSKALWADEAGATAGLALVDLGEHPPARGEPLWLRSGFVHIAEHQMRLRMQIEGKTPRVLAGPERLSVLAPELRLGSERQAGVRPGTVQKLRAIAAAWAKDDPSPFVVLVARHRTVFLNDGFNGFARDAGFFPASIGKTIAGLTFARAVDQGLIGLDQPVGTVLDDWQREPTSKVTFRHCFNHVSGLTGHASHRGLFNAYLDNALWVEDAVFATPGSRFQYNGDDVNLAGKALEMVTGQSIWRLLYEHMEKPFDEPVRQMDLGFGDVFTAMYLAKVGQMVLQDGRYGRYRFFRPGFLETLRPRRIADFAPGLDDPEIEAGIGLAWMPDPPGPRARGVLGPNVLGHGASSGAIWRIDPAHEAIVVVGRDGYRQASANDAWATKFVEALADAFVD
ncbi:MAG: serine hydrolase [Myxococcota bacterium]|nr:serine hydrolase [Myxococcota bacterium]